MLWIFSLIFYNYYGIFNLIKNDYHIFPNSVIIYPMHDPDARKHFILMITVQIRALPWHLMIETMINADIL